MRAVPWALAGAAIAAQIAWPLTDGAARVATTEVVVFLFAAAAVAHAWIWRGGRWAGIYTATAVAFGFAVELVGTATGFPFSTYAYTDVLQPQLAGVPLLIPLAWTMMAYPALLVGRTLSPAGPAGQVLVGAWALASWDLFLDPQMVAEDYWRWASDGGALPGVPGIPGVNYLGWLAVSLVLMLILRLLLPPGDPTDQSVPALLYGWTWIGGIIANAVFLDRPAVAVWGGLGMGVVAAPYLLAVLRGRQA